jgi:ATP-dependent Lhr-like helicase
MSALDSVPLAASSAQNASLDAFHPAVRTWFARRFDAPTDAQRDGWPAIRSGHDALLAAPTGSGKTLAAFLAGIDMLIRKGERGELHEALEILYVSPLKALGADIYRNLEEPLREIRDVATEMGYDLPEIRIAVRSGDSTSSERQAITRRPPHILITTPESLYLMLTAEKSRPTLRNVHTVIVDEIHALLRDRRGSHLGLSLARLDHVADQRPARIGLSATQRPIEEVAAYLVGSDPAQSDAADKRSPCVIVDRGHQRALDISIETPPSDLEAVASAEQWGEVYGRLAELVEQHHTTLIFVNTRRLAERVAHHLSERLGPEHVASHHGSLSKERRLQLEQRLKAGEMRALVATASLELGIDIGSIDLVCQVGSPRSISTFLQRVGRSGHALGLTPCGKLFPTTRDELVECAALIRAVRGGRLDRIVQPKSALDVLAQQIVAECACEDWRADDLYDLVRGATQYQHLARTDFDDVVEMLSDGIGDIAGRTAPLLHRDRIGGVLRGRRGARLKALTNGGTIPETGDFRVVAEPDDMTVGSVNEDFAIESMAGDIFLLGTTSWRIKRIEAGVVRVENAHGAPPTIPFWLGEAPGRTLELSQEVGALRRDIVDKLPDIEGLSELLQGECGLSAQGADQAADYVRATHASLGVIPSDTDIVFERFFDEAGDQHLVVHAPFGARINRAWGLALRKRFCVRFDFELQAAASDDAIVLSIGPAQSFPLEESFDYVKADNVRAALEQAILYVPLFGTRWRWNATRALAVDRWRNGKKVPPQIQRMRSDDLLAAVFPAQVGCQENISGPIDFPDHPLIKQTLDDCLNEAMDLDSLTDVLRRIEAGEITLHARDTTEPSPMAHEIINSKPFTFLDDAPLEERRTRAVQLRHALPRDARDLAALDPDAIQRVREEAWPDPRNAEEVHDALLNFVAIEASYVAPWTAWLNELVDAGRAATAVLPTDGEELGVGTRLWIAAEHLPLIELLYPRAQIEPVVVLPDGAATPVADRDDARLRLARGHAEAFGPLTASILARTSGLVVDDADRALRQIEALGDVLRGHFTTTDESDPVEFCDRRLLARIHRYTLDRLRREIDPVGAQDYMRFLLNWQHLTPGTRLRGKQGLREAIRLLQGFEAPAMSWERDLLPARVAEYNPAWLDDLCLGGEVTWARLSTRTPRSGKPAAGTATPSRVMPVTVAPRNAMPALRAAVRRSTDAHGSAAESSEPTGGASREILALLRDRGALFFDEIVDQTHRLATDVERGLRDLVARGLTHADGFEGLRQLAGRRSHRRRRRRSTYGPGGMFTGTGPAGRWAPITAPLDAPADDPLARDDLAERIANTLLLRYGVVFRDLMERERFTLPWRDILRALRRMEARGIVRGGRFVSGFVGEQYALPQAVAALRATRRKARTGEQVYLSAVDPCNLVGIVLPGEKIVARAESAVLLVDGAEPADQTTPAVPWPSDSPAPPTPAASR